MLRGFVILLSYFTRIPIGNIVKYDEEKLKKSVYLYSLMGAVIGGIMYALYLLVSRVHIELFIGLSMIIAYVILTGGIHLDGYSDSIDGLYSGRDREKMLEIMKDSRVGAFGVIGLVLLMISYVICFSYVDSAAVFFMPIAGRLICIVSCFGKKYARKSEGMGTFFVEGVTSSVVISNIIIALLFSLIFIGKINLLISMFISLLVCLLISKGIERKIAGMTGDTCGFITEVGQIIFLIIYVIIM